MGNKFYEIYLITLKTIHSRKNKKGYFKPMFLNTHSKSFSLLRIRLRIIVCDYNYIHNL